MANNSELAKIGMEVLKGRYVLKSTLFLVAAVTFCAGGFLGFVLSNIGANVGGQRAMSTQGQAPQSSVSQSGLDASLFRLEEEARKNPNEPAVWVQLGNFLFDHGQAQASVNAYEKALALQPDAPDVLVDCGIMYRELKQFDKAIVYFDRAIKVDHKHQNARFNKGIVLYNDLNKKAEGVRVWKELLSIHPNAKVSGGLSLADFIKEHPVD